MISIIIPVYDAALYLRRCLDSVLAQTYGQWETICVDDGSTDSSLSILEEYANKDGRFKVASQKNGGASAARNTGIRMAVGDYVFFLDSDDEIVPNCLELMRNEVERYRDVEVVVGSHAIIKNGKEKVAHYGKECYITDNRWVRFLFFKGDSDFSVVPWNMLIKYDFIRKGYLFFREGIIHEDELWAYYLYKKLSRLVIINDVTYIYHVTPTSVMSTNTSQKRGETINAIINEVIDDFDDPARSLQVFKYLEYYRNFVLPCVPKAKSRRLYFRFLRELLRMGQIRISFYWLANWFRDIKHSQLYYQMIPMAYKAEEKRYANTIVRELESL